MFRRLLELAQLFSKLGTFSFGGPAAHIGQMEHEVVHARGWMTREQFVDLIGATNLIPGPNSTEMAAHIGYCRAGLPGSLVAGAGFVLPAVLLTGGIAWGYKRYGTLPQVEPLLYGIQPVVVAILMVASWRLGRPALKGWQGMLIGAAVAVSALAGADDVVTFLVGSVLGAILFASTRRRQAPESVKVAIAAAVTCTTRSAQAAGLATSTALLGTATAGGAGTVPLWQLGLFFLKVGAILYGTGYVLVAYLEGGLVERYGWLTRQQLLDAIAIGQFTPGPLLSTATFIGYLVADWPGAVVATAAIFGPSFLFVALTNPLVPRMRKSYAASLVLDAVNAASIGLMLAVTLKLAWALPVPPADMPSLTWNWPSLAIALTATVVSFRWKIAPAWLVLGGATAGGVVRWLA